MIDSTPLDGGAISDLIDEVIELDQSGVQHTVTRSTELSRRDRPDAGSLPPRPAWACR